MRRTKPLKAPLALAAGLLLLLNVAAGVPCRAQSSAGLGGARDADAGRATRAADVRRLAPGASVEGELIGGGAHHYLIELAAGQHVGFEIEYQGVNGSLTLKGPDGVTIIEANLEAREHVTENASLVAQIGGLHTLVLEPDFKKAPIGRYRLTLEVPRAATEEDRQRFTAQISFVEATVLVNKEGAEARVEALKKLEETLPYWRGVGDRVWEARVLFWVGWTNYTLGKYPEAIKHIEPVVELRRASGDGVGEAEALRTIGTVYTFMEQHPKALKYFNQAMTLHKEPSDRWQLASTYNMLGYNALRSNDAGKASDYLNRARRLMREAGDDQNEAATLANLSAVLLRQGDYQSALDNLRRSLEVFRELKRVEGEASTLNLLGITNYNLGEREKALEYFDQSVLLARSMKNPLPEAFALSNSAMALSYTGDKRQALRRYEDALRLMRQIKNLRGEATVLLNMGKIYHEMGEASQAAETLEQALTLARQVGEKNIEGSVLTSLGWIFSRRGEYVKAREHVDGALKLRRGGADRREEAMTLSAFANVEAGQGKLQEARGYVKEAVEITESLRARVTGPQLRISYMAINQDFYRQYIDILMRLHEKLPAGGYDAEALHASERARARALLDSLAEARVDIRHGVDRALIERERSVKRQLNAKDEERFRLLAGSHEREQATRSAREIDALLDELQQVQTHIRASSPLYASLPQPHQLDLKGIQSQLDEDTLLLVYSLDEKRSFLWAVTQKTLETHILPAREEIEDVAFDLYERLKDSAEIGRRERYYSPAERLSGLVLAPVAGRLVGKRLVVVADGKLQYIPFAALPSPVDRQPLILGHEVINLSSVSVLERQRRELSGRAPAPRALVVVAEPVFEADDVRFKTRAAKAKTGRKGGAGLSPMGGQDDPRSATRRAERDAGGKGYSRLEFSRYEADMIARLVPRGSSLKILGFEASRETIERTDLRPYRIVHFSTHGLLNEKNPELSGIVLSQYDRDGRPQDGFLRAHELYDLKLGADLVVLSACETALGREFKGEGFISLARSLMYAGAPRVVVSLWMVSDVATAELMKRFYHRMLLDKLPPAAALRAAQASMAREKRWSAPAYWAGFTLQGEWR
jgi:CHAT domain-containing protein/tetratricopeptide (TPR) repeat protein